MQLTKLLMISSLLTGCVTTVERPDADFCIVNAPAGHQKCYNMKRDYGSDGKLKPGAVATFKPAKSIEDLNKNACTDPDGLANLKIYQRALRAELQECLEAK